MGSDGLPVPFEGSIKRAWDEHWTFWGGEPGRSAEHRKATKHFVETNNVDSLRAYFEGDAFPPKDKESQRERRNAAITALLSICELNKERMAAFLSSLEQKHATPTMISRLLADSEQVFPERNEPFISAMLKAHPQHTDVVFYLLSIISETRLHSIDSRGSVSSLYAALAGIIEGGMSTMNHIFEAFDQCIKNNPRGAEIIFNHLKDAPPAEWQARIQKIYMTSLFRLHGVSAMRHGHSTSFVGEIRQDQWYITKRTNGSIIITSVPLEQFLRGVRPKHLSDADSKLRKRTRKGKASRGEREAVGCPAAFLPIFLRSARAMAVRHSRETANEILHGK